jgi:xanthine dehydrogenase accessory factor
MRALLQEIERWLEGGDEVALATVVGVRGSSPRPAGARLAVTRRGRMSGAVSAGCVESDVHRRAIEVLDRGVAEIVRFSVSEVPELDVGLSCGGSIDVLIEPFAAGDVAWRDLADAVAKEQPVVLVEILEPVALRGTKLALRETESLANESLSHGMRAAIVEESRVLLRSQGGSSTVRVSTDDGECVAFLEAFLPEPHLYVVGATEIGIALAKLARVMGLHVTVVDPRAAYAKRERFDESVEIAQAWPRETLAAVNLGRHVSVVTLTHDPKLDIPALSAALRSDAGYIGALGSRRTHEKRKQSLAAEGFTKEEIARVHGPVGLDLGGKAPEEIALSIVAEIVAARHGRDPRAQAFTTGVILAAGASTRMGRPKQILTLEGKPLLQHVIDAASSSKLDEVIVVLGANADAIRADIVLPSDGKVRVVINDSHAKGLSESIRAGLAAAASRSTAVAILLGDQPRVSTDLIDRMLAAHAVAGKPATRPIFGGAGDARTPGHPVVLARSLWTALRELEGDDGARAVLAKSPELVSEVRILAAAPADIDTPYDYRHAQAAVAGLASRTS